MTVLDDPEHDRLRRDAESAVQAALDRSRSTGRRLAVLLVAVGDAARIDRVHGHAAGARAIAEIEARVRALSPPAATVLRIARERIVVLPGEGAGASGAGALAGSLATAAREPVTVEGAAVRLDATVGAAVSGAAATGATLLRDADGAAQRARAVGGAPWRLADEPARARDLQHLRLEGELADALERDELALYLQPIVSLRRGAVVGVEALVRWRHPTRGLIAAADFLPTAEESGLIVEIGDWVLTTACGELGRWADDSRRALALSLNVSSRELRDETFAPRFEAAREAARIPAGRLALEIAELAAPEPETVETLVALRRQGVRIVLDRFGGDGSALAHLARLPVDGLKLDRALLDAHAAERQIRIAEAVVQLARGLGLSITIPGVETQEQLAIVRSLHVDAAQGHLIARPTPAEAIPDLEQLATAVAAAGLGYGDSGSGGDPADAWLSLSTVAAALGVSPSTVRRLADQGVLPGRRTDGGHRRFRRGDVQRLARQRQRPPVLRPLELPAEAFPAAAGLLRREGRTLVERAARTVYDSRRPGWFAAPQGLARARAWLDALSTALAAGTSRDAVAATGAYADAAALGGASPAEVVRFLGQFGAVATHELLRARTPGEEPRVVQRVMSAGTEAFLERLG